MEAAGFVWSAVYEMKNHQSREYCTSRKIHKNGVKIRFNRVVQSDDEEYCQEVIDSGYLFIEEFGEEVGKNGENHPSFKGFSIGYNKNQIVILAGAKEMKENGFNPSNITDAISGKYKSHAKMKWYRVQSLSDILPEHRLLEPFNELTKQRLM